MLRYDILIMRRHTRWHIYRWRYILRLKFRIDDDVDCTLDVI